VTWPIASFEVAERLDFRTTRVSEQDAARQLQTVRALIDRLSSYPGIVLADEVGMGKTFVALGVAVAAALSDRQRRPAVVMVPPSLHEKWPRDFEVFRKLVLVQERDRAIRAKGAATALEFLRLLDNPPESRPHLIFLKHGAFHAQTKDHWLRFALICRAISGAHLGERRSAVWRFAADILSVRSRYGDPELYRRLMNAPFQQWKEIINRLVTDPALQLDDDPVPGAVCEVLDSDGLDLRELCETLRSMPSRESPTLDSRLAAIRVVVRGALKELWPRVLRNVRFRSPLLVLDEAHHLKNPQTLLSSLFVVPEAEQDAHVLAGALDGAFERMLFLTATPFQLGHRELLKVLGRFEGVDWSSFPEGRRAEHLRQVEELGGALNAAHVHSCELDSRWGSLGADDLTNESGEAISVEEWWLQISRNRQELPERIQVLLRSFDQVLGSMKKAETLLQKLVVRHLRDKRLPGSALERRLRWLGSTLQLNGGGGEGGIAVEGQALLPFLLAARAQAVVARSREAQARATFAEGLASSYEAFLTTRAETQKSEVTDELESSSMSEALADRVAPYLQQLAKSLPSEAAYAQHPKVQAVVDRVVDLWAHGEKVVVFCHYRATGRALVKHISNAIEARLWADAGKRAGLSAKAAEKAVIAFGERFDQRGAMRSLLGAEIDRQLRGIQAELDDDEIAKVHDVVTRFVRTPPFVARYFSFTQRSSAELLTEALAARDLSNVRLSEKLETFLRFIAIRCSKAERQEYLDALDRMQPGGRGVDDAAGDGSAGFVVLPNVRLAIGRTAQETRQRLMLCFNTPFFPDVLVASSVLAEGVDLHLNCRFVIHHDLSWNPSTIEQRTGRVDRIGAKAETIQRPIEVFLPFIGATHDEKQFRVVMDRERWFQVLMGETYRTDEFATEGFARRIPLPLEAAQSLAFDLRVWRPMGTR
jgi:superfamily II DNA or RNA helicase